MGSGVGSVSRVQYVLSCFDFTRSVLLTGCFFFQSCDQPFEDPSFFLRDEKPFCENCFTIMIKNEM